MRTAWASSVLHVRLGSWSCKNARRTGALGTSNGLLQKDLAELLGVSERQTRGGALRANLAGSGGWGRSAFTRMAKSSAGSRMGRRKCLERSMVVPLVRPGMVDGIYAIPVPMTTPPKSRKRPGPPSRGGRGILIGLRLQKDDYKAAVDWGKREDVATLPEAIRQLMRLGLAASRSGKKSP